MAARHPEGGSHECATENPEQGATALRCRSGSTQGATAKHIHAAQRRRVDWWRRCRLNGFRFNGLIAVRNIDGIDDDILGIDDVLRERCIGARAEHAAGGGG